MFLLALVFCYEIEGQLIENSWNFSNLDGQNAELLTSTILSEINSILKNTTDK